MNQKIGFLILLIVLLSGCTTEDKQSIFDTYGKANAFISTPYGPASNVNANNIVYYSGYVDAKYHNAADIAANEFNKIGGITIMIRHENSFQNSSYKLRLGATGACDNPLLCGTEVINLIDSQGSIAENHLKFIEGTQYIEGSTIYYNYQKTYHMSQNELIYVSLHELGHTLGLKDLTDPRAKNNSVMYKSFGVGSAVSPVTSLYEFDIANLEWMYSNHD